MYLRNIQLLLHQPVEGFLIGRFPQLSELSLRCQSASKQSNLKPEAKYLGAVMIGLVGLDGNPYL